MGREKSRKRNKVGGGDGACKALDSSVRAKLSDAKGHFCSRPLTAPRGSLRMSRKSDLFILILGTSLQHGL